MTNGLKIFRVPRLHTCEQVGDGGEARLSHPMMLDQWPYWEELHPAGAKQTQKCWRHDRRQVRNSTLLA